MREPIASRLSVPLVSIYLLLVGAWLVATRQIRVPGIRKVLRSRIRPRYRGELTDIRTDEGVSFVAHVPSYILSDLESASALVLMENGKALGPAHSRHDDIRRFGRGRFSHWGNEVYFSTSDNSDPRSNSRKYTVVEVR